MVVLLNLTKMSYVALKISTVKGTDCNKKKKIFLSNGLKCKKKKIEDIFHKLKFSELDS